MTNLVRFSYIDKQGKRLEFKINQQGAKNLKIFLLERSCTEDVGDIFIYNEELDKWEKLCYYND